MNDFSPGLHKFIQHTEHIHKMNINRVVAPLHVSIWPTLKCNFNCSYCCCRNSSQHNSSELNFSSFKNCINTLAYYGTKAIEFSGGGEPLLWNHFEEAVQYIFNKGLKISLITNGTYLHKVPRKIINKIDWIRISLQSEEHAKSIDYSHLSDIKYSGSYIVSNKYVKENMTKLFDFVKENNIVLRVATQKPCTKKLTKDVSSIVKEYGSPLFFSDKEVGTPLGCYMPWIRAAIDWNGNFLPCPSIQLNKENEGKIPKKFILCHIDDIEEWLQNNTTHDLKFNCTFCNCGKEHNDYIHNMKRKIEDAEFV